MIQTFRDEEAETLFSGKPVKKFEAFQRIARRKLEMLNAATVLADLLVPPGNRLERLKGKRSDEHSIRVNDRWRICFRWNDGNAYDVEIEDYH